MTPPLTLDDLPAGLRARLVELGDERLTSVALRTHQLYVDGVIDRAFRHAAVLLGWGAPEDGGRGPLVRPGVSDLEIATWEALLAIAEEAAGVER